MAINQGKLNSACENYCGELRNKVVLQRKNKKQGHSYWDFPIMASVCQSDQYGHRKKNFSRPMRSCNQLLLAEINQLGHLGKRATKNMPQYNGAKNYPLGQCAEQHAANDVLNELDRHHQHKDLHDLFFSTAMQVRDNVPRNACVNCKTLLPNVQ